MPAKAAPKRSKSVLKRARQTKKRTLKNRSVKSELKSITKKIEGAVINKNAEEAKTALKEAIPVIDRAAVKGIIHSNTASRRISRLVRLVNSLLQPGAA